MRERVRVRAKRVNEVKDGGMPAPALTPCPSLASGRGEQTGSVRSWSAKKRRRGRAAPHDIPASGTG
ncbi:hypothetical protein CBM2589_B30121 [Cupriavidus taiwanensis]|uniref:Uncharacterized protein n=1 Tax=Cupriavidus taiwanensis TaxID=164546 RepID=A0A975X2I6_9BURK|nr:hypothetical protein CBM2589_B30121 [Cupriavidus taiwanensis]